MHDPNAIITLNANLGESVTLPSAGNQLLKGGLGELVLGGNSVYTGLTTVSAGTLRITNPLGSASAERTAAHFGSDEPGDLGHVRRHIHRPRRIRRAGRDHRHDLQQHAHGVRTPECAQRTSFNRRHRRLVIVTHVDPSATIANPQTTHFLIEFLGTLAGQDVGNLVIANSGTAPSPVPVQATVINGNTGGTTVNTNAAIVLDGSLSVGNEVLTLNSGGVQGSGFFGAMEALGKGHGSLLAINGSSVWGTGETPITLAAGGANVSIGAEGAANALTLNSTVVQSAATVGLNKVGTGTLVLAGVASNTYAGTTTVSDGTLALNKTPGMAAFLGAVTIGDNMGTGTDALELRASVCPPGRTNRKHK